MDNMFFTRDQFAPETLENGVVRTVKGYIGDLMVVELRWKRGMEGAVHTHRTGSAATFSRGCLKPAWAAKKSCSAQASAYMWKPACRTVCWRGRRTAWCSTFLRPCGRIL